jgi:hypothetical protein
MSGTLATYQGWPVRDVRFRRTRGWRADTTTVLLLAADFPAGFEFVTPVPGDLVRFRTEARLDLCPIRGAVKRPVPLAGARRLEFAGALVLAEVDRAGQEFVVRIDPLYYVSIETARRNADGTLATVVARLVDARYFHAQGFLRRWSFNRRDGEGAYAPDSVKAGGEPFALAEVAGEVAQSLFGTPKLTQFPETWTEVRPAIDLPRFSPASTGLAKLAQEHGAGELCLNLDGSVALWAPGEGRVGYAPGGEGHGNTADLPPELFLDLGGAGQSRGTEATYPPDFVVVVGGLRVASVRMDDLEPVLVIEGQPIPLNEETVQKLTGGRFGLAWLHQFVLAPQAYQNEVGLDPRVTQLLREQAYHLWRIPGVEVEAPPTEGPSRSPLASGLAEAPSPLDRAVANLQRDTQGQANQTKGPNAHLLPLRDRAETSGGRRLPVRVDTYRFTSVHRAMAPSREAEALATAQAVLDELKQQIRQFARRKAVTDPFDGVTTSFLFDERYATFPALHDVVGDLDAHGVTREELEGAVSRARLVDRIREVAPHLAGEWEKSLRSLARLQGESGGPGTPLLDLAKEIVDFEKSVAETRSAFETPDEELRERGDALRQKLKDELRALDRQREERGRRTRVGAGPRPTEQTAVFVRNLSRQLDPGARVFSAELGIVQTSDLSGHVAKEGVPVAEATTFVPRSPLVTFGAVLRPRAAASGRVATGLGSGGGGATVIPECLSDTESYYHAAFRRVSRGRAEPFDLAAIPVGQGVPIERPDLVELVPLEGESNRAGLDETARSVAEGIFGRPDRVDAAKYSVARPWPVNTDGVVAGVEIAMRPNGKGFVTTIHVGSDASALKPLDRTRPRVRRGATSDAAAREGLLP